MYFIIRMPPNSASASQTTTNQEAHQEAQQQVEKTDTQQIITIVDELRNAYKIFNNNKTKIVHDAFTNSFIKNKEIFMNFYVKSSQQTGNQEEGTLNYSNVLGQSVSDDDVLKITKDIELHIMISFYNLLPENDKQLILKIINLSGFQNFDQEKYDYNFFHNEFINILRLSNNFKINNENYLFNLLKKKLTSKNVLELSKCVPVGSVNCFFDEQFILQTTIDFSDKFENIIETVIYDKYKQNANDIGGFSLAHPTNPANSIVNNLLYPAVGFSDSKMKIILPIVISVSIIIVGIASFFIYKKIIKKRSSIK